MRNSESASSMRCRPATRGWVEFERSSTSRRSSVSSGSARRRRAASRRARPRISESPPAMKGERRRRLARSKAISRPASSRMRNAASTSGCSSSGAPSEILKGCAAAPVASPDCVPMACENSRRSVLRRVARSGTTMPMREAPPPPSSSLCRAQRAAWRISSRASRQRMRWTLASLRTGLQVDTSLPAAAIASKNACCCAVTMSNP